jgi:hypothetical protein
MGTVCECTAQGQRPAIPQPRATPWGKQQMFSPCKGGIRMHVLASGVSRHFQGDREASSSPRALPWAEEWRAFGPALTIRHPLHRLSSEWSARLNRKRSKHANLRARPREARPSFARFSRLFRVFRIQLPGIHGSRRFPATPPLAASHWHHVAHLARALRAYCLNPREKKPCGILHVPGTCKEFRVFFTCPAHCLCPGIA